MRRSLKAKGAPPRDEALNLLRRTRCPSNVIAHCKSVARNALELASRAAENGFPVDFQLVIVGALLHDIGRKVVHNVRHGVIGAEMARSLGVGEQAARIIERHVGAGIPAREAAGLGLPEKDYIPVTIEEKIVCYADKITRGSRMMSYREALLEFQEKLGGNHPATRRFKKLHGDILQITREEG